MKKAFCIFSFFMLLLYSPLIAQNSENSKVSIFSDFEQLGIHKDSFIKRFGLPTSKDLSYDKDNNTIEALLYKEELEKKKTVVITKFTFKNGELIEQKSEIVCNQLENEILEKIVNDLMIIRHWVQVK